MNDVTMFRLNLLRAMYLLIVVGLGLMIWPRLVNHGSAWALQNGDAAALLAGISVMALLGLRYPLQMLPLLLFELVWKTIWLLAIALPLWAADAIDAATRESIKACLIGVILVAIVLPWRYVFVHYFRKHAEPWTGRAHPAT